MSLSGARGAVNSSKIGPSLLRSLLCILLACFFLAMWKIDPSEKEVVRCLFLDTTGIRCPGCGMLRATHELMNLRPVESLHFNPMVLLTGLSLLFYFSLRLLQKVLCSATIEILKVLVAPVLLAVYLAFSVSRAIFDVFAL